MGKVYRTAKGKKIDMGKLMAKNETIRAVGNMRVNARGDTIDAEGRVTVPVTKKVSEAYKKQVKERAEKLVRKRRAEQLEKEEFNRRMSDDKPTLDVDVLLPGAEPLEVDELPSAEELAMAEEWEDDDEEMTWELPEDED